MSVNDTSRHQILHHDFERIDITLSSDQLLETDK